MREIKFRGKRIDNGEWVYGSYFPNPVDKNDKYILFNYGCSFESGFVKVEAFRVDPETVGQYTGLKDKNGKEIYEGDVFRYTEHPGYLVKTFTSPVKWIDEYGCFGYDEWSELFKEATGTPFSTHDDLQHDFLNHLEVIGDVHSSTSQVEK